MACEKIRDSPAYLDWVDLGVSQTIEVTLEKNIPKSHWVYFLVGAPMYLCDTNFGFAFG